MDVNIKIKLLFKLSFSKIIGRQRASSISSKILLGYFSPALLCMYNLTLLNTYLKFIYGSLRKFNFSNMNILFLSTCSSSDFIIQQVAETIKYTALLSTQYTQGVFTNAIRLIQYSKCIQLLPTFMILLVNSNCGGIIRELKSYKLPVLVLTTDMNPIPVFSSNITLPVGDKNYSMFFKFFLYNFLIRVITNNKLYLKKINF